MRDSWILLCRNCFWLNVENLKCCPVARNIGILNLKLRVAPITILITLDDASFQILPSSTLFCDIIDERIMFIHDFGVDVAAGAFGVEQVDFAALRADNKIDVEQGGLVCAVLVTNGIMLLAIVAVLVPPVEVLSMCLEVCSKLSFR